MVGFRGFQAMAFGIFALGAAVSPALAALPSDPCNPAPQPSVIGDGSLAISLPNQQSRGWQRQGGAIEISVASPKIVSKASIFVCFKWKLIDPNAVLDAKFENYKKFVPSGAVTGTVPLDKPSGPLAITVSVPTTLPEAPDSPRTVTQNRPVGVYALNNQFPLADIRVLLYADGEAPILDLTSVFGVIGADVYCDMPLTGTTTDSGIGAIGEHKKWQPVGGEFEFTIKATKVIPANAPVLVCFRWKLVEGDPRRFYDSGPTRLIDKQPQTLKVAATLLTIPDRPDWWPAKSTTIAPRVGDFAIPLVGLVPLADARILVLDNDGTPIVDVRTTVGVTNLLFAGIITALILFIAFYILYRVSKARLVPRKKFDPLLCVITTRRGYASLSQFQIILWTFVVIASASYVMSLSGDLIEITAGTLVLLGISGSALVISKAKGESDAATAPPPPDPVAAAAAANAAEKEAQRLRDAAAEAPPEAKEDADGAAVEAVAIAAAARAKAVAADAVISAGKKRAAVAEAPEDKKQAAAAEAKAAEDAALEARKDAAIKEDAARRATRQRHPRWSDLVMEENQGRELDVTRVQMLYFTLITAAFVLLTVVTSYAIPVIPEGFLILMGISNSVYVGSKFATNPAAK